MKPALSFIGLYFSPVAGFGPEYFMLNCAGCKRVGRAFAKMWVGSVRLCLIAFLLSSSVHAATLKPPLQTLRSPEFTLIAGQRLDRPMMNQRLTIQVTERFRGDAEVPDEIELLVLDRDDAYILPGVPYLLAYSDVQRVPGKVRSLARNPERRQLLHIDGADPAVFADTPENRALLSDAHREIESGDSYLQIILTGLASGSPPVVDLWSAELAIRPATLMQIQTAGISAVENVVNNPLMRPASRARLLLVALDAAPALGQRWYVESAQSVLQQTSIDLARELPGTDHLIYTALLVAQNHPEPAAGEAVRKWLQATPPLAENAALALRAIDPDLELKAVTMAIEKNDTPEPTRQMLIHYLKRLERMRTAAADNNT